MKDTEQQQDQLQATETVQTDQAVHEDQPRDEMGQRPKGLGAQKQQKNVFDAIWDFFSSVPVGIAIILILAVASIIGTIYPQVNAIPSPNPDAYYLEKYGDLGDLYHRMGFSDTYNSWWYLVLVMTLAISLVIVSIDRGVPLYKSLKNQPITRKVMSIRGDRLYAKREDAGEADLNRLEQELKKRRYKVRRESGALLAEKGRLPRFGAYIIHVGLLVIIAGVFVRLIPGWYHSEMVWLKQGETKEIAEVGFALKNNGFSLEFYDKEMTRPKKYETDIVVYEGDQEVAKKHLLVNEYLKYNNTYIFQNSYDPTPMFKSIDVDLIDKKTERVLGHFQIDFGNIKKDQTYKAGEYEVKMVNYYPDLKVDQEQGAYTISTDPYAPGMRFDISGPGLDKPSNQWFLPMAPFMGEVLNKDYPFLLKATAAESFNMTGILLQRDLGVPIVYTGCGIVMWGLVLCFYFQHRRIWARVEDDVLHIGGNTNKLWMGLTKELNKSLATLGWESAVYKQRQMKK